MIRLAVNDFGRIEVNGLTQGGKYKDVAITPFTTLTIYAVRALHSKETYLLTSTLSQVR